MYVGIQNAKYGRFKMEGGIKYQVVKKALDFKIPAFWPSLMHGLAFLLGVLKFL